MIDGFELLEREHREVEQRFDRYAAAPDDAIAHEICERLTLHSDIEERALYPALRRYVDGGDDLADRAEQEHAAVKLLIARVYGAPPDDLQPLMQEIRENVERHVQEEEQELFPEMRDSRVDPNELGDRLEAAKRDATNAFSQPG